jgi:hypothetical protein
MPDFMAKTVTLTEDPWIKILDSSENDRVVTITAGAGFYLTFDSSQYGAQIGTYPISFVLPDDTELWGYTVGSSVSVSLIVSRSGGE